MDNRYLTAAEAAEALGVSVQTLYVYVGRKGIRSQEVPGSRSRKYWKADIDRVRRGDRSRSTPSAGDFRPETGITLITESDVFYRGQSAIDLAETASFESVAALLWDADEHKAFSPENPQTPKLYARLDKILEDQDDVNRATALFPILEDWNAKAFDLTSEGMARTGADILRWLAALTVKSHEPTTEPLHLFLADRLGKGSIEAELIRRMLILSADHGFEPGTVAVRAVASTGITPWRSVIAGLSISFGRRGHLGGIEATRRLLQEIAIAKDPATPILQRIKDGEAVPGFNSLVYTHGDPRGHALIKAFTCLLTDDPSFVRLQKALLVARDIKDLEPNFALACLFILERVGAGPRSALFHIGRAAGWIAHAIEQSQAGEMLHQAEVYTGRLPS